MDHEDKIEKCPNYNNKLSFGKVRYVTEKARGLESFAEWRCVSCRTRVSIPLNTFRHTQPVPLTDPQVY